MCPITATESRANPKDWLLIVLVLVSPQVQQQRLVVAQDSEGLLRGCATANSTHYCCFQAIRLREQCVLKMICVGTESWNCLSAYLMGLFILNVPGRSVSWPVLWTLPNEFRKFWYIGGFESKHNSFVLLLGFVLGSRGRSRTLCVCVLFFLQFKFFTFVPVSALKRPAWAVQRLIEMWLCVWYPV